MRKLNKETYPSIIVFISTHSEFFIFLLMIHRRNKPNECQKTGPTHNDCQRLGIFCRLKALCVVNAAADTWTLLQ